MQPPPRSLLLILFSIAGLALLWAQEPPPPAPNTVNIPLDTLIKTKTDKDKTDYTMIIIVGSIISSVPPTLMALAAVLSSLRNTRKQDEAKVELVKINTQTNSHLSQMTADLNAERARNRGLEEKVNALIKANDEKHQLAMKMAGQTQDAPQRQ